MSSPTQAQTKASPLADLFSKCSQITEQQERETSKMVGTLAPLLAWLNEPIVLRPEALGGPFVNFRSVSLEAGAMVIMTDYVGGVTSKLLAELRTEEKLAVLKEAFPELERLVANKRRAAENRPALSLRVEIGGSHRIVDRRTYRLNVSNTGGDCSGLSIAIELPGGWTESSRPIDVARGETIEVDLGRFKEMEGLESLRFQVDCKDLDGRELRSVESLQLEGAGWIKALLKRKN